MDHANEAVPRIQETQWISARSPGCTEVPELPRLRLGAAAIYWSDVSKIKDSAKSKPDLPTIYCSARLAAEYEGDEIFLWCISSRLVTG
jgi:hypothetical protein